MANETDTFNRWEAGQKLTRQVIEQAMQATPGTTAASVWSQSIGSLLQDVAIDPALCASMLSVPGIAAIGADHEKIDIELIDNARNTVLSKLAEEHESLLKDVYARCVESQQATQLASSVSVAQRSLKLACLNLLAFLPTSKWLDLAIAQYEAADNMTDAAAALSLICHAPGSDRDDCLAHFYRKWKDHRLVIDKWFTVQALSKAPDTLQRVIELKGHSDFDLDNPNRVRSLIGAFAMSNTLRFHDPSGSGYQLLCETILQLDTNNPQLAARLASGFSQWRRFDENRQKLVLHQLSAIRAGSRISPDLFEIIDKSLHK